MMKLKDWKTRSEWLQVLRPTTSLSQDLDVLVYSLLTINYGNRRVIETFINHRSNTVLGEEIYAIFGRKWEIIARLYEYEHDSFNMDNLGVVSTYITGDTSTRKIQHDNTSDKLVKESAMNSDEFIETNQDVYNHMKTEVNNNQGERTTIQRSQNKIEQQLIDNSFDLAYNVSGDIANFITYRLY